MVGRAGFKGIARALEPPLRFAGVQDRKEGREERLT